MDIDHIAPALNCTLAGNDGLIGSEVAPAGSEVVIGGLHWLNVDGSGDGDLVDVDGDMARGDYIVEDG